MGHLHGVAGPPRRRLRLTAAFTSALLSLLFLGVYGFTNWYSALRSDVGTWYFEWEQMIPFVPLMFVPYMSIDLFFVAAPFLCRDFRELSALARQISFAILVAGASFLLMPLHFAFERPHVSGWLGQAFDAFRFLDRPYNLFPSLHITFRAILVALYHRHTRGVLRVAVHAWFFLIGLSTVLTYQHHVMDVVGGFILAGFCLYLFDERAAKLPVQPNVRIAAYYGLAAIVVLGLAFAFRPWGTLLLWPVGSFGIMSAAYLGVGPGVFRKHDGRLIRAAWFVLGPILLGHWLSLLYYRRQCRAWDRVTPRVWIGRRLNNAEAAQAVREGVTAVLDLTAEFDEARPFRACAYRAMPILDLTAPRRDQLHEAVAFIAEHEARGIVYVHCKIGYSRSAAVVAAYLLASGAAKSAEDALACLRAVRPSIVVRPEALQASRTFEREQCSKRVAVG